ncbi:MAG: DUF1819 family protein [Clostridiaceae bacterium]|nr:DUF1819 family protein [Clostridiaceae bacterium]
MKYSAGMTSKIFGFIESKKMAEMMTAGKTKEEIAENLVEGGLLKDVRSKSVRRVLLSSKVEKMLRDNGMETYIKAGKWFL